MQAITKCVKGWVLAPGHAGRKTRILDDVCNPAVFAVQFVEIGKQGHVFRRMGDFDRKIKPASVKVQKVRRSMKRFDGCQGDGLTMPSEDREESCNILLNRCGRQQYLQFDEAAVTEIIEIEFFPHGREEKLE